MTLAQRIIDREEVSVEEINESEEESVQNALQALRTLANAAEVLDEEALAVFDEIKYRGDLEK